MKALWVVLLLAFPLLALKPVDASLPYLAPLESAAYLKDAARIHTFETFQALEPARLTPTDGKAEGFGFSGAAYWFRFEANNPAAKPVARLLAFEPTWLDHIEGRVIGPSGAAQSLLGGDCEACNHRVFEHARNVFELTLEPGVSTVLILIKTRDPFVVAMELWEERAFFKADGFERGYMGFMYGVLLAMALYNLFLYGAIRDHAYGFYALYVLSFVVMNFTYSGYSFFYLWPGAPEWSNWAHAVFIYLFALSGPLFAAVFLDTKNRHPKLHRMVLGYAAAVVATAVLSAAAGGYALSVAVSIVLVVIFAGMMFFMGVAAWTGGNRAARFFILGTSSGLIGAIITALTVSSVLPFHFLTYRAADMGMILDALFLSMALADRYKTLKHESDRLKAKDAAQEAVMLRQHQQAALGNLIGAIAHQMKQPLSVIALAVQSLGEGFRQGDLKRGEIRHGEETILRSVDFMARTIDQFRNYFRPDKAKNPFELGGFLKNTLELLGDRLRSHGIETAIDCPAPVALTTYENELQQVILNLISNACDALNEHKAAQPKITLDVRHIGDRAVIGVEDNGGGIAPEAMDRLFELFYTTKGSEGTGIGLYLCRSIVTESLKGSIAVRNGAQGARFEVTLPLA